MNNFYYTKIVTSSTGEILVRDFRTYRGEWATCKGAPPEQTALGTAQSNFYNELTKDYSVQFSAQQKILQAVQHAWGPVLQAGPSQYGFSKDQDTTLRTQSRDLTATSWKNIDKAAREGMATAGGGNELLPSGVNEQIHSSLMSDAARQDSSNQLGITQAGYERGYQEFLAASNAMLGVGAQYNPVGYASAANQAGGDANSTWGAIAQENQAASPWGAIGGILGGAADAAITAYCPAEGSLITLFDGGSILVENIVAGTILRGMDGGAEQVLQTPSPVLSDVLSVDGVMVSPSHTFVLFHGGYVLAKDAAGASIFGHAGVVKPVNVQPAGKRKVYPIKTDRTHSYAVDGLWSLE